MSGRPNNPPAGMFLNYFITNLPPNIPNIFSSCLEKNNTRPMGLAGSTRVSTRSELLSTPVQQSLHPRRVSLSHQAVLNHEVKTLLDKRAVHQVQNNDSTGFTSSLFVVPKKDGGNRPVVNLKLLNQVLVYEHFKMII
jgi:hypothetical protein